LLTCGRLAIGLPGLVPLYGATEKSASNNQKNVQDSRYDSANHPHAGVRCAARRTRRIQPLLTVAAFQPAPGQCRNLIQLRILPEPESRNGLSLARNSAFATIAGSMLPTCAFDSTLQTLASPFDFRLLRSVRFRGRYRAKSSPKARFPRQFAALLQFPRHPLPFGCFNRPSGSKRSTGSATRNSPPETPDVSYRGSRLASFRSTNRSVNPGTESIMNHPPRRGQTKKRGFSQLSSGFSNLIFQLFTVRDRWIPCAKISMSNLCSKHFVSMNGTDRPSVPTG
jgi:hypothetical protein